MPVQVFISAQFFLTMYVSLVKVSLPDVGILNEISL